MTVRVLSVTWAPTTDTQRPGGGRPRHQKRTPSSFAPGGSRLGARLLGLARAKVKLAGGPPRVHELCVCADSGGRNASSGGTQGGGVGSDRKAIKRGRPAWKRSPDDTPFRDGNRDRLMGLLTREAVQVILHFTMTEDPELHAWIQEFDRVNEVPDVGSWDDVSGDGYLRSMFNLGLANQPANVSVPSNVDPRSIATQIMDIRVAVANEWMENLKVVPERNLALANETLYRSLGSQEDAGVSQQLQAEWEERQRKLGPLASVDEGSTYDEGIAASFDDGVRLNSSLAPSEPLNVFDRLLGLLTTQAVNTLVFYTMETNQQLHHWIRKHHHLNPIPKEGSGDDVSGTNFLRKLLNMGLEAAGHPGIDPMFDCTTPIGVDPRSIAQRVMDVRKVLAKEWREDLSLVTEENGELLKSAMLSTLEETLQKTTSEEDAYNEAMKREWEARVHRLGQDNIAASEWTDDGFKGGRLP